MPFTATKKNMERYKKLVKKVSKEKKKDRRRRKSDFRVGRTKAPDIYGNEWLTDRLHTLARGIKAVHMESWRDND